LAINFSHILIRFCVQPPPFSNKMLCFPHHHAFCCCEVFSSLNAKPWWKLQYYF